MGTLPVKEDARTVIDTLALAAVSTVEVFVYSYVMIGSRCGAGADGRWLTLEDEGRDPDIPVLSWFSC